MICNSMLRSVTIGNKRRPMGGWVFLSALLVLLVATSPVVAQEQAPGDTLILVNEDPITVADLDAMVLEAHQSGKLAASGQGLVYRYLEKRVNDLLLLQDALASGMDQEPEVLEFAADKERQYAIQAYVKDNFTYRESAPEDSVRAFFDRYYWRIQLRQVSVRTREEAEQLRAEVLAGADMDSLARAVSLDTKKLNGGLFKLLHWADIENVLRDQVRTLGVGDISPVFPFRESFTFVRVEQRTPVDEESFAKVHDKSAAAVLGILRQRDWDAFLARTMAKVPVNEDMNALFAIAADSAQVLQGSFVGESARPVLFLADGPVVTEAELRKAVSHEAMTDNSRPFAAIMAAARTEKKRGLVLGYLASQEGYPERADVQKRVDTDWEQLLIQAYLNDAVASRITFKKGEFEEFYQKNLDRFRGPDEVRLEILILDDEAQAKEASQKLAAGADFGFVFGLNNPNTDFTPGKSAYISTDQLSKPFRDQLENMQVGQSSQAVEMPMGWMVFQLADQRPGTPPPLEGGEMDIRKVIYQEKFNDRLDELLDKLKSRSTIVRHEDRIKKYFNPSEESGS